MNRRIEKRLGFWLFISGIFWLHPNISPALSQTPIRTADLPDSWLVLYNLNNSDSILWAGWYSAEWGIPLENLLGLNASTDEHLSDLATAQAQILTPVRDYLAANPAISAKVMGVILGYGLPGHYAQPPIYPDTGGFSIADALTDLSDDQLAPASQKANNTDNPHYAGKILPVNGRLTRSSMSSGKLMAARIDAPTLTEAMNLTLRAKALSAATSTLAGQHVWFDYKDPNFPPASKEWYWLKVAVQSSTLADLPWSELDLQGQVAPRLASEDAFRFDVYKLYGWSSSDFSVSDPGSRVLAFDFNSFGLLTVRSTTNSGALFAPNALASGYAAVIGSTGEPQCCVGPFPDTLLASLREGWTLGEAYYLANPYNDWMWTLVGDPLLRLPNWFNPVETCGPLLGDMNADGVLNALDIQPFVDIQISDAGSAPLCTQVAADMNQDNAVSTDDVPLFVQALLSQP